MTCRHGSSAPCVTRGWHNLTELRSSGTGRRMQSSELALSTALLAGMAGLLIPPWLILVGVIPACMVLIRSGLVLSLFTVGDAHVEILDVLTVMVVVRLLARAVVTRAMPGLAELRSHLGGPLLAFFGSLFLATCVAHVRFGGAIFVSEMIPLLRFAAQTISGLAIALAIRSDEELARAWGVLRTMGYLAALSLCISVAFWALGLKFGEVQETDGIVRWFGPIGDEVSLILALFVLWEVASRHWVLAGLMVGAMFLTGTRGAVLTLAVGGFAVWWLAHGLSPILRKRVLVGLMMCCVSAGGVLVLDPGAAVQRFTEASIVNQGLGGRIELMSAAASMFADSPLTGVGFQGFRLLKPDYDRGRERLDTEGEIGSNAANQYLQTAADGGFLAVLALLWLGRRALQMIASERVGPRGMQALAASGWLWGLLVGAQTVAWLVPSSLIAQLFWLVLGLAVAGRAVSTRAGSRQPREYGVPAA